MPPNDPNVNREYLVVNGERAELEDYDLNWIRQNCEVNEAEVVV